MGFLQTQTEPATVKAVFDIRAHSVGIALVAIHTEAPLEFIWQKRRPVHFNEHYDDEHLQRAMRQTLERLLSDLQVEGLVNLHAVYDDRRVDTVRCIFSRPWNVSSITSAEITEPEPFPVTRDHIYTVGSKAYKNFPNLDETKLAPLHHSIVGIYGDGRLISSPYQKTVRKLTLRMHVSKVPHTVKRMVRKVMSQRFHPDKLSFHSATDMTSRVLSRAFSYPKKFLVFIPEHTQTDILLVEEGRLQELESVPIGEDFLVRTISDALERPLSDIRSRLRLHQQDKHHPKSAGDLKVALDQIGKRWRELSHQVVENAAGDSAPEHSYLLASDSKHSNIFKRFFLETMQPLRQMQTHIIDEDLFTHHFTRNRKVDSSLALGILGTEVY